MAAERLSKSVVVDAGALSLYALWTQFEDYPRFMRHVRSVTRTGKDTTHWVMCGATGRAFEWDAKTIVLEPGRKVAWRSLGGDLELEGEVTLTGLSEWQTEVTVTLRYQCLASGECDLGTMVSDPEGALAEDLERFKEYAEGRLHQFG